MPADLDVHYDFAGLLDRTPGELLEELAAVHSAIAALHTAIAFLRAEETRGVASAKPQRYEAEGLRDAYTEKKWLLKTLLDHAR